MPFSGVEPPLSARGGGCHRTPSQHWRGWRDSNPHGLCPPLLRRPRHSSCVHPRLAGRRGFEPLSAGLEPDMLPLHQRPVWRPRRDSNSELSLPQSDVQSLTLRGRKFCGGTPATPVCLRGFFVRGSPWNWRRTPPGKPPVLIRRCPCESLHSAHRGGRLSADELRRKIWWRMDESNVRPAQERFYRPPCPPGHLIDTRHGSPRRVRTLDSWSKATRDTASPSEIGGGSLRANREDRRIRPIIASCLPLVPLTGIEPVPHP